MAVITDIDLKLKQARTERYAMQSVARKALPHERVSKCLRLVNNRSNVEVWKHTKMQKAFYNGLLVCGSVWNCPICAAKISEKRRLELKQAFNAYKAEDGHMAFLTLTFSHSKFDSLQDILNKFLKASKRFKSGRAYQDIKKQMGIEGTIKALEVTYSDNNGFHPHSHEIIFYKNECNFDEVKKMLWIMWKNACEAVGLSANEQYGLTLQSGEDANEYLSKFGRGNWSLEQEMTKAHIKKGKNESSLTPFDFLKYYLESEEKKYLRLFQEYAMVFKGRRQLVWSKGLKKRFAIEDKTDEEVAKERTEEADLLGLIDYKDWKIILKYDLRSELLNTIEQYGFELGTYLVLSKWKKESSGNEDSQQ